MHTLAATVRIRATAFAVASASIKSSPLVRLSSVRQCASSLAPPLLRLSPRRQSVTMTTVPSAAATHAEKLRGPEGLFSKILAGVIPSKKVYEDEKCYAFADINPQAPVHVLLIPRQRIALLADAKDEDQAILGHLMLKAAEVARIAGLEENGYRVMVNNGLDGCQAIGRMLTRLNLEIDQLISMSSAHEPLLTS
jgi:histidine triad (HIT) family protein